MTHVPYLWVALAYGISYGTIQNPVAGINNMAVVQTMGIVISLVLVRQMIALNENNTLFSTLVEALQQVRNQAADLDQSNSALRQEIIERSHAEAQLAHDAIYDKLTGLANRVLFVNRLQHGIDLSHRNASFLYSVLFLDLDNFKNINDSLGHSLGDAVLIEVGQKLLKCTRAYDTVARYVGDEFAIMLEDKVEENFTLLIAQRILHEMEKPLMIQGNVVNLTCSIGIVQGINDYTNPEEILRDVDLAMVQAKQKGKGRSEVFNLNMRTIALDHLALEAEMRVGIPEGQFVLHYQPFYRLDNGRLAGLEALVRWNHPTRGWLMPNEFIAIAERSGLIESLGAWVLSSACSQFRQWMTSIPDLDAIVLNVNISAKQIIRDDFTANVRKILETTQINPQQLYLEITENIFVENQSIFANLLFDLREIGVRFMIDDFGTGYSSLGYLKSMPVTAIKIDRSFVNDMLVNESDYEIIRTIVRMAESLKLSTIVEGIETPEQLQAVKALNCVYGQGFYLSRPRDVNKITEMLRSSGAADF